jgi:prepilin-type N-terminal cleavage/methylation domain-containing protein
MPASSSARRRLAARTCGACGFTLLEVMAAVAILGILYATLARVASQGILSSGESRWRIEASLAADREMAALELEQKSLVPLEPGISERVEEPFTITREVEVFELPPELLAAPAQDGSPRVPAAEPGGPSLFGSGAQDPGILRRVTLRVSWFDGVDEQSLERVTFAYDTGALAALFGGEAALGAGPGGLLPSLGAGAGQIPSLPAGGAGGSSRRRGGAGAEGS